MLYPILYKIDTKDKIRTWQMETEFDKYRTIVGIMME